MAAIKSDTVARSAAGAPTYTVNGPHNNAVRLQQAGANLHIIEGASVVVLSQANAVDLLAALTAFAGTGRLPS